MSCGYLTGLGRILPRGGGGEGSFIKEGLIPTGLPRLGYILYIKRKKSCPVAAPPPPAPPHAPPRPPSGILWMFLKLARVLLNLKNRLKKTHENHRKNPIFSKSK